MDAAAGVRISVWQPYAPSRTLTLKSPDEEKVAVVGEDAQLQQEVFAWQVHEDVWGGVIDEDVRRTLSERCLSDFEPTLLPGERTFEKLSGFLVALKEAIPASEWSDSGHDTEEELETPYRVNALLAFYLQLTWVHDVFQSSPGASVSIR